MTTYTLARGQRYRATLTLGWLEQIAGNDMIAGELARAGFEHIDVTGSGDTRVAEGTWTGESQEVKLPEQVTDLTMLA